MPAGIGTWAVRCFVDLAEVDASPVACSRQPTLVRTLSVLPDGLWLCCRAHCCNSWLDARLLASLHLLCSVLEGLAEAAGRGDKGLVIGWLPCVELAEFAKDHKPGPTQRRLLARPTKSIQRSTAERKMDIGFIKSPEAEEEKDISCHWSQILIPGELKSNPSADVASPAWLDLGIRERCSQLRIPVALSSVLPSADPL